MKSNVQRPSIINRVPRPSLMKKVNKYKYLEKMIIKSVFVLIFLLVLLLIKKIDLNGTNNLLEGLEKNINYEFSLIEDGKKIYYKTKDFIEGSLESIEVFNLDSKTTTKYSQPITGTIYKTFGQDIIINDNKVKNSGLDLKSMSEQDPQIVMSGVVSKVVQNGNKGYFVTIKKDNIEITYGYLSKSYVSEGNKVEVGDLVGLLGTNKDGSKYLRIEFYIDGVAVDPADYIDI